ncbi:MAG TPA: hypothetical protein P5149_15845 [Candidatus Competibacteraceae bacterium]|nr:hypothetical protein [Candidatus Competibacteraceae bacterium]
MTPGTAPIRSVMRAGTMVMTVTLMVGPVTVAIAAGMCCGGKTHQYSTGKYQYRRAQHSAHSTIDQLHGTSPILSWWKVARITAVGIRSLSYRPNQTGVHPVPWRLGAA